MTVRAGVDNVTDENYWSGADDSGTSSVPRRTAHVQGFGRLRILRQNRRSGQGGRFLRVATGPVSVKGAPSYKHTGDRRERRVNIVGCRRGKRPDASSRFTEPTYSTYRPWRRHRYWLFLGIGPAIQMAGPAVLLGYAVAGIVAFLIMRQLGEMVVEEPVSGSFAHFAYKYWGPFAGFLRLEPLGCSCWSGWRS